MFTKCIHVFCKVFITSSDYFTTEQYAYWLRECVRCAALTECVTTVHVHLRLKRAEQNYSMRICNAPVSLRKLLISRTWKNILNIIIKM